MNGDDYAKRGTPYVLAWHRLFAGCEIPPSLEQFDYGLAVLREESGVNVPVEEYAARLVRCYQPIPFKYP